MAASFGWSATVNSGAKLMNVPTKLFRPIHFAFHRQETVNFDARLLAARLCKSNLAVCGTSTNAEVGLGDKRVVIAWAIAVRWILNLDF